MRRLSFLLAIAVVTVAFPFAAPAEERILRFDAAAEIRSDASFVVTESIRFVSEGKDIKRGLIRTIPTDFTDAQGKRRRAGFEIELLKPAAVLEIERYSDAQIAQWDSEDTLTATERKRILARLQKA